MLVLNEPASNAATSAPEPATSSTFPVCNSATCAARTGDGVEVVRQVPQAAATTTTAARRPYRQARRIPPMDTSLTRPGMPNQGTPAQFSSLRCRRPDLPEPAVPSPG